MKKDNNYINKNKLKKILNMYKIIYIILVGLLLLSVKAYADKKTINVINKEILNPNIVMLGDSITEIYNLNEFYGEDKLIVNSGISGNKIKDISSDLKSRVYNYNPSKVFLLIGINDILWERQSSDYVYENTIDIVKKIHKKLPNTKIYIESIYPYNDECRKHFGDDAPYNDEVIDTIKDVNSRLEEFSNENNYTEYINLYDKLKNEDDAFDLKYSYDGLHPNEEGFKVITEILKKYM